MTTAKHGRERISTWTRREKYLPIDPPYVPDESVIVELGESVGQVVKRDRRNFLKIVIFEQRVLDQPVCRPRVRFRQIEIVLSVIQHLNKRTEETEEKKMNTYFISSFSVENEQMESREWTFSPTYLAGGRFEFVQSQARIVGPSRRAWRYTGRHHYPGYGQTWRHKREIDRCALPRVCWCGC